MSAAATTYSLIVPVYRNEASIPALLDAVGQLDRSLGGQLEAVFVVDGSPDRSQELLEQALPHCPYRSRLVLLSRNFGSFAAIRAGLAEASGPLFAVMAADLQEPPELVLEFFAILDRGEADVVVGTRRERADGRFVKLSSRLFWGFYRRFVQKDMPPGGVDMFGCDRPFRDRLLALEEANSSLVGLIFWLGFRRVVVPYDRRRREHGRSAWTISRRFRYLADSIFAFTDFPVRMLLLAGALGLISSVVLAVVVLIAKLSGSIDVPGYAAIVLTVLFLGALNSFALGVIGSYVWRAYENTKGRPPVIVSRVVEHAREEEE
jgi:polyisoprenyl-phosphate glycosyltransferase